MVIKQNKKIRTFKRIKKVGHVNRHRAFENALGLVHSNRFIVCDYGKMEDEVLQKLTLHGYANQGAAGSAAGGSFQVMISRSSSEP